MMMWNRLRYTVWAPAYDALVRAAGFDAARRLSIDRLRLAPNDRVLIVGAGTGLDLDFVPSNVHVTPFAVPTMDCASGFLLWKIWATISKSWIRNA